MIDRAEYKRRQAPPGVRLRPKAFGRDRRTPITNRWRELTQAPGAARRYVQRCTRRASSRGRYSAPAVMAIGAFGPWLNALGILSLTGWDVQKKEAGELVAIALLGEPHGLPLPDVDARRASGRSSPASPGSPSPGGSTTASPPCSVASIPGTRRSRRRSSTSAGASTSRSSPPISLMLAGLASFFFEAAPRREAATPAQRYDPNVPTVPAGWYSDPNDAVAAAVLERLRLDDSDGQAGQLTEPAQPLLPRHGSVRGRRRRQHEEPRLAERRSCTPSSGRSPNVPAVRLLADERDPRRAERRARAFEPLRRAGEVGAAEVARAGRRPRRRVRRADPVLEQLELLRGLELPRREAGRVQQPPEVVARIREVRAQPRPRRGPG